VDQLDFIIATATNASGAGNLRPAIFTPGAETVPADNAFVGTRSQKYISYPNNVLAYDMNRPAGSSYFHKPRGSWVLNRLYGGTLEARSEMRLGDNTVYVEFKVTEPLLLSPFTFGHPEHPGFYGISNLSFNFSFTPNASRAFRSVKWNRDFANAAKTATIASITGSELQMMFLTAHPSLSLSSRNVVPYYELPVYKTVQSTTLAARGVLIGAACNVPPTATAVMSSNTQLNQVPDKLIICCRRIISKLDCTYADSYSSISNEILISIIMRDYAPT
jgi:hypothetical protein